MSWTFRHYRVRWMTKIRWSWLILLNVQKYWRFWTKNCLNRNSSKPVRRQCVSWIMEIRLSHLHSRLKQRNSDLRRQLLWMMLQKKRKRQKIYQRWYQTKVRNNCHPSKKIRFSQPKAPSLFHRRNPNQWNRLELRGRPGELWLGDTRQISIFIHRNISFFAIRSVISWHSFKCEGIVDNQERFCTFVWNI